MQRIRRFNAVRWLMLVGLVALLVAAPSTGRLQAAQEIPGTETPQGTLKFGGRITVPNKGNAPLPMTPDVLLFDSFSAATSFGIPNVTRTFIGFPFNTINPNEPLLISKATVYLASATAVSYTNIQVRVQFWNDWNGTTNPVFSNAAGGIQVADLGAFTTAASSFYTIPLTFASPIPFADFVNNGYAVNFQGDTGSGLASTDDLTTVAGYGASPFAVGTTPIVNAYGYRNASGLTNFNFNSTDARTFTQPNQGIALQLFGNFTSPTATATATNTQTNTPAATNTPTATATPAAPVCFSGSPTQGQEVPPTGSAGTGSVFLTVYPNLTYDFSGSVFNLSSAIQASHIHNAPAGSNGGVVVNLGAGWVGTNPSTLILTGQTLTGGASTLAFLQAGNGYFNIHTANFGGGEIRGQLAATACTAITPTATNTSSPTATNTPTATSTSTPAPALPDTIGLYDPVTGLWFLRNSNTSGVADITALFGGSAGQLPVVGDWNGNGDDTLGIYDTNTGVFQLSDSNTSPAVTYGLVFGNPGDTPFAGRWTNSATHDGVGVYRNSNGVLFLKNDLTTGFDDFYMVFGNPGDQGIGGDWNGDGIDNIGIYRASDTSWYLSNTNGNGVTFSDIAFNLSIGTGKPVVGDWDADGDMTVGFYATSGIFSLHSDNATAGTDNTFAYGSGGNAYPVAGIWTLPPRPPLAGGVINAPSGINGAVGGGAE